MSIMILFFLANFVMSPLSLAKGVDGACEMSIENWSACDSKSYISSFLSSSGVLLLSVEKSKEITE